MDLASRLVELLWIGALAAIPLSLVAALACRWGRCGPATRHAIWTAVLASFVLPFLAAALWKPVWIEAGRAVRSAEAVTQRASDTLRSVRWGVGIVRGALTGSTATPTIVTTNSSDRTNHEPLGDAGLRTSDSTNAPSPTPAITERRASDRSVHAGPLAAPLFGVSINQTGAFGGNRVVGESLPRSVGFASMRAPTLDTPAISARPTRTTADLGTSSGTPTHPASGNYLLPEPDRRVELASEPLAASRVRSSEARSPGDLVERSLASSAGEQRVRPALDRAAGWASSIPSVRSAMSELPPLPVSVWTGGLVAVVVISAWRTWSLRRIVATGTRASSSTIDLVEECAERIGLAHAPETVMVADRVSPLVWCGSTARLVLPGALWAGLAPSAKRAVVMHELAHLRRLDHRLCWLVGAVGALYWWHPVAWWAQRKLRDEADLCCDAWVTTLLPGSRRAYAEVLLTTKVFLSEAAGAGRGASGPRVVAGLSMVSGMSGRSKRMARRLTMVMKERVAPRASVMGVLAAISIAAAGTFVTPGLACPPEKGAASARAEARGTRGQVLVIAGAKAKRAAELDAKSAMERAATAAAAREAEAGAFMGEAPALEAMRHAAHEDAVGTTHEGSLPGGDSLEKLMERLHELEARIARLDGRAGGVRVAPETLARALAPLGSGTAGTTAPSPARAPYLLAPTAPGQESAAGRERAARETLRVAVSPRVSVTVPAAPASPGEPSSPISAWSTEPARVPQPPTVYSFPGIAGQAPALTAPAPGTTPRAYTLPSGKLQALVALMERQDVPIFIERHSDKIVVHATPAQHEAFAAFITLIHPEASSPQAANNLWWRSEPFGALTPAAPSRPSAQRLQEYRRAVEQYQRSREQLQRRVEQSQRRSESIRERSDMLRDTSEQLQERAEAAKLGAERASLMAKAQELSAKAEASEAEADALEQQGDELEAQLDEATASFEEVEAQLEELAEAASEEPAGAATEEDAPASADSEPAGASASEDAGSEPIEAGETGETGETEGQASASAESSGCD